MTKQEATVIEMYTGVCMLTGDDRKYFYEYAEKLLGRPIMTHEYPEYAEKLKELSKPDFLKVCKLVANDGWIPVEEELPPNAKHKGALCPRYQLNTKYGVTEGWYNPDLESWFVLVWFQTERYLESEIDFEKGSHPKIVRCGNKVNDRYSIVTAWRPLPEPYQPCGFNTFLGGHT